MVDHLDCIANSTVYYRARAVDGVSIWVESLPGTEDKKESVLLSSVRSEANRTTTETGSTVALSLFIEKLFPTFCS